MHFIEMLEERLGRKAEKNLLPMQPGDVPATYRRRRRPGARRRLQPATPIEVGIARFVTWYREYYKV